MEPTQSEQALTESQSSIEVTRGVKGEYGWKIKLYTGSPLPDIDEILALDIVLKQRYVSPPKDYAPELEASLAAVQRGQNGGAE